MSIRSKNLPAMDLRKCRLLLAGILPESLLAPAPAREKGAIWQNA
jgi:hypothetical protein